MILWTVTDSSDKKGLTLIKVLIIILIIVLLLLILAFRNYVSSIEEQNKLLSEGNTHLLELEKVNMNLIQSMYEVLEDISEILEEDYDDDFDKGLEDDEVEEGYEEV